MRDARIQGRGEALRVSGGWSWRPPRGACGLAAWNGGHAHGGAAVRTGCPGRCELEQRGEEGPVVQFFDGLVDGVFVVGVAGRDGLVTRLRQFRVEEGVGASEQAHGVARSVQPVVADLPEALGQDVGEESPDELVALELDDALLAIGLRVTRTESHMGGGDLDDPAVGDRHTAGVPGQVLERVDGGPIVGRFDMNAPLAIALGDKSQDGGQVCRRHVCPSEGSARRPRGRR